MWQGLREEWPLLFTVKQAEVIILVVDQLEAQFLL